MNEKLKKASENKKEVLIPTLQRKSKRILTELVRKGGVTYFQFAVAPEIEKLFNKHSREKKTSDSWQGLEYYHNPEILEDQEYINLLSNYGLRDSFGSSIIQSRDGMNTLNIAWLRTVGGVGKIEVDANLPYAEIERKIKDAMLCIKTYFDIYLREFSVKGTIEVEM